MSSSRSSRAAAAGRKDDAKDAGRASAASHYDDDDSDEEDEALQQRTNTKRRKVVEEEAEAEAEEQQHDSESEPHPPTKDTAADLPTTSTTSSSSSSSSKPTAASRQTGEKGGKKPHADDAKNTPSIMSFFGGGKQSEKKKKDTPAAGTIASFFAPRTAKQQQTNSKPEADKEEQKEAAAEKVQSAVSEKAAVEEKAEEDTAMQVDVVEESGAADHQAEDETKDADDSKSVGSSVLAVSPTKQQQQSGKKGKQPVAATSPVKPAATTTASKKRPAPDSKPAASKAAAAGGSKGKKAGPMSRMQRKKQASGKAQDDDGEEDGQADGEDIDMSDVIDAEEAAIEEEDAADSSDSDEEDHSALAKELIHTDSTTHSSSASSSTSPLGTPSYHPIKHATWSAGQPVTYSALSAMFACIEAESSRLKIIAIVSDFFRSVLALTPRDILPTVYLCINSIAPAYEGMETGVGDHILKKVIAQTTGLSLARLREAAKEVTDLGVLALSSRKKQVTLFSAPPLTVRGVFGVMREMGGMSGKNVANKKEGMITKLMVASKGEEAKYLIRSLQGSLRIGLQIKSVIASLARALVITPPAVATATDSTDDSSSSSGKQVVDTRQQWSEKKFQTALEEGLTILKQAYIEVPNLDLLIQNILQYGLTELPNHCSLTPGVPIEVMLGKPASSIVAILDKFSAVLFTLEYKYDGERAQIHRLRDGTIRVYSRNSENNTGKYPDIVRSIKQYEVEGKCEEWIIDTECVAWDKKEKRLLPFQTLTTRKRKDVKEDDITVSVCLFAFDLLYLNGQSYLDHTLRERREVLHSHFKEVEGEFAFAIHKDTGDVEEIQAFLTQAVSSSCEGLMVKALEGDESKYTPGKRSWLKCKKDYLDGVGDTLDLVPIAAFYGKGKRTGAYGAYVLACYDDESEEYQSITKIGTGFSEDDITRHAAFYNQPAADAALPPPNQLPACPRYYKLGDTLKPDVWLAPVQVWEVKCADLSISPVHQAAVGRVDEGKGIALRFPRFVRVREDKKPDEATTAEQVVEFYHNQSNRAGERWKGGDDDD